MEKSKLQKLLECAGYSCHSYSGRGMHGAQCLAVTIDGGLGPLVADLVSASVEEALAGAEEDYWVDSMKSMCTDAMGMGTVVYFPGVQHV